MNNDQEIGYSQQLFQSIRQVPYSALTVEKQPFRKGVFGKCYSASMSVHIKVCVKAFRCDKEFVSTFPKDRGCHDINSVPSKHTVVVWNHMRDIRCLF